MKWSLHIEVTCSKAKRILGLLYRRFYGLADCRTIIQLYLSIVRPHLEYTSWSSHIKGHHFIGRRAKVCMQNCYQALDSRIPTVARNLCNTLSGGAQNSTKVMSVVQHFVWSPLLSSRCFCVPQINILLDPITWFLASPLHTLTLFYIHLYPILFLYGIICLKSKCLLPLQAFKELL